MRGRQTDTGTGRQGEDRQGESVRERADREREQTETETDRQIGLHTSRPTDRLRRLVG